MKVCRYILFASISLGFILTACSPVIQGSYSPCEDRPLDLLPVFGSAFERALFTFIVSHPKRQMTGIVLIKRISQSNSYRVVFMSETGLNYFDAEFFSLGLSKIHYVADVLNRKAVVRFLTGNFGMMFEPEEGNQEDTKCFRTKNPGDGFLLSRRNNGKKYFFYNSTDNHPFKIQKGTCFIRRSIIEIPGYTGSVPEGLSFSGGNSGFTLQLNRIIETE
jgi:hypothetical protein